MIQDIIMNIRNAAWDIVRCCYVLRNRWNIPKERRHYYKRIGRNCWVITSDLVKLMRRGALNDTKNESIDGNKERLP